MKHLIRLLPLILILAYAAKFAYHWIEATRKEKRSPGAETKSKEVFPMVKREAELSRQFNEQMKGGAGTTEVIRVLDSGEYESGL